MPPTPIPGTAPEHLTLDVSGIAGFLGGKEAVAAMESAHLFRYRKYLGLYNSPGSYAVAKRYAKLVTSRLTDGPYLRVKETPATLLKMDGQEGPKYVGTFFGTQIPDIGHIGYLLARMCRHDLGSLEVGGSRSNRSGGSMTMVAIISLINPPDDNGDFGVWDKERITIPPFPFTSAPLRHIMTIATILLNIGACLVCGIFQEWYAFALILVGISCNGFACFELGSAKIFLKRLSTRSKHPGHGVLSDRDHLIVLQGTQAAVNRIIYGRFDVEYGHNGEYNQQTLGAIALVVQFTAQLSSFFLIPQSGLFGQILFVFTLLVSWINNACLATIDLEALQKRIVMENLPFQKPGFGTKYHFLTRTSGVVFAMLQALPLQSLRSNNMTQRQAKVHRMLSSFLPRGDVWEEWLNIVSRKTSEMIDCPVEQWEKAPFQTHTDNKNKLLSMLLGDANLAVATFCELATSRTFSSEQVEDSDAGSRTD